MSAKASNVQPATSKSAKTAQSSSAFQYRITDAKCIWEKIKVNKRKGGDVVTLFYRILRGKEGAALDEAIFRCMPEQFMDKMIHDKDKDHDGIHPIFSDGLEMLKAALSQGQFAGQGYPDAAESMLKHCHIKLDKSVDVKVLAEIIAAFRAMEKRLYLQLPGQPIMLLPPDDDRAELALYNAMGGKFLTMPELGKYTPGDFNFLTKAEEIRLMEAFAAYLQKEATDSKESSSALMTARYNSISVHGAGAAPLSNLELLQAMLEDKGPEFIRIYGNKVNFETDKANGEVRAIIIFGNKDEKTKKWFEKRGFYLETQENGATKASLVIKAASVSTQASSNTTTTSDASATTSSTSSSNTASGDKKESKVGL